MSVTYREADGSITERHKGAVLIAHGEHNYYDDSYFYAVVWDAETAQLKEVEYAATAYASTGSAETDATREVIALAIEQRAAAYLAEWEGKHDATVRMGMTARVTVKGETFEGTVEWIGEARAYTAWDAKYGKRRARYGVKVEGRKGFIFRNEGSPSLEVDVPAWSAEDRAAMVERATNRAHHDFREALRAADVRDPLPAAPAPGDVVDSQEADAAGWRLYAVGESFCEDGWAQKVARAVVDESAGDYVMTGQRADGSDMPRREGTVYKALGTVARWADGDDTQIMHDGAGAVRMVRDTGAWLELRPVRPQEAAGAPQEDGEQQGAAEEARERSEAVREAVKALPYPAVSTSLVGSGPQGAFGTYADSVETVNRWLAGGFLHKHNEQQVPTHHGVCDCAAQEEVAAREAQREPGVRGVRAEYRARLAELAAPQGEPCLNCQGVAAEGEEDAHGAPCGLCGSDGHAGCQHVSERVA